MTTLSRYPLVTRPSTNQISSLSPATSRKLSSAKRARSPEPGDSQIVKRSKAISDARSSVSLFSREDSKREDAREAKLPREERERKRLEREEDFRVKYTRAFPGWSFHFDIDPLKPETAAVRKELEKLVLHMGARIDDFFSKNVSHLIVLDDEEKPTNKENHKSRQTHAPLLSPIKLKGRFAMDPSASVTSELVPKALAFGIKVWSADKLRNVIERCLGGDTQQVLAGPSLATSRSQASAKERSLMRLLETERLHGTTGRDIFQKRPEYTYFAPNSFFVLVEDMRQELATIIALEYPVTKTRDGTEKGSWPVLHCHPLARGPFNQYDEKEERRREKIEQVERDKMKDLERRKAKLRQERRRAQQEAQRKGDLRRTVSMQNMRRESLENGDGQLVNLDADFDRDADSAAASGYLASGTYVAASGNSVGITSATGTTSTAGMPFRTMQLPPSLRNKLQQQVVTSRKPPNANGKEKENLMGPPAIIPDRPLCILRKSRSTNTMRLPKRDENSKPGYCESCRVKFEDFKEHIHSKRHRKFAEDDANFANLDAVLARVRRRTVEEVRTARGEWEAPSSPSSGEDAPAEVVDDHHMASISRAMADDDIQWDDWVDADEL